MLLKNEIILRITLLKKMTSKPRLTPSFNSTSVDVSVENGRNSSASSGGHNSTTESGRVVFGPSARDYKKMEQRKHVYTISDTYIGSDEKVERTEYILRDGRITAEEILLPQGVERVILEILSNASDNIGRSRKLGVDPESIEVTMDRSTISVKNYGLPIPVEIHPEEKIYAPEMILGTLLTSSNYEVERYGAGRNGLGAKLCNIFSKFFRVIVYDGLRGLAYLQEWRNNMQDKTEPNIKPYSGKSSVEITFVLDFERFKYNTPTAITDVKNGYPDEAFGLVARHCADISFTCKIPVRFNGVVMEYYNIRDYARLYHGDIVDKNCIIHYEYPTDVETYIDKSGKRVPRDDSVQPCVELCIIDTPDAASTISFVNSMMTRNTGVHVDAAIKAFGAGVATTVNERSKSKKGTKGITITEKDVAKHVSFIISCFVVNPKFDAQTKTKLCSPKIKIEIADSEVKCVSKWELLARLYADLQAKQYKHLQKSDGKKREYIEPGICENAYFAGGRGSHLCKLYAVEGKSAMGYPRTLISLMQNGKDYIGIFPFKGKILNVMNATPIKIGENVELKNFKAALGLQEGVDYSDDDNFDTLRYGEVRVMVDADDDGKHILGLLLLYFNCRFPSLLQRGYVKYQRTPCLRVWKGARRNTFHTFQQYELWRSSTPDWESWTHKYYKGLGTSDDDDIAEDSKDPRIVSYEFKKDRDDPAVQLAFHRNFADARKIWMNNYRPLMERDTPIRQSIKDFIDYELIQHSRANVVRSIPLFLDGLKPVQRKLVYSALKRWSKNKNEQVKVSAFATYALEETNYHHGPKSLEDSIKNMARAYTGSNNMPYFMRDGQFGTRYGGGKDCAESRYISTRPEWWLRLVYRKEDDCLLRRRVEEGEECEPYFLLPIIPMLAVNGVAAGIGTGYSTFFPAHNPLDVINWLKCRLNDMIPPTLTPWYRGFTGVIEIYDEHKQVIEAKKREEEARLQSKPKLIIPAQQEVEVKTIPAEDEEDSDIDEEGKTPSMREREGEERKERKPKRFAYSMVSYGKFSREDGNMIVITELPIGCYGEQYRMWLERLWGEGKMKRPRDCCKNDNVHFEIQGFTEGANVRSLRLRKTEGLTNMTALDMKMCIKKYPTTAALMEDFYTLRLTFYEKRKENIIATIDEKLHTLNDKLRFIILVRNKTIIITEGTRAQVNARLQEHKLPTSVLSATHAGEFSDEGIRHIEDLVAEKKKERDDVVATPPKNMWLRDLEELEEKYRKHYKDCGGNSKAKLETYCPQSVQIPLPPPMPEPTPKVPPKAKLTLGNK